MKNIYCILGPSGSGKTTLSEALNAKYGYKPIESYTTRSPRFEGETGHVFVSQDKFNALGELCAYTQFDGHEYGVTSDLIDKNDVYVIDPAGVDVLRAKYNGIKGIKVIGIVADVDVLVERMEGRGDSDEKIIKRLANDAEMFKDFHHITDVELRSDSCSLDELCEAAKWHIENYEYWHKHDFSLVDEKGQEVHESNHRYYDVDEAMEDLKKHYPHGLPEGWSLRDDTEIARDKYLKAIKRLKPSFKSSMIKINMDNAGTSNDGYTMVSFDYQGKNYFFRSYHGDEWVTEKENIHSALSGKDRLNHEIKGLYKRIDKIDRELDGEYSDGETAWASQLEIKKERLEKTICFLEAALEILEQERTNSKDTPSLDDVIKKINEAPRKDVSKKNTLSIEQCR